MLLHLVSSYFDLKRSLGVILCNLSINYGTIFVHLIWQKSVVEQEMGIAFVIVPIRDENFFSSWNVFTGFHNKALRSEIPHSIGWMLIVAHIGHWYHRKPLSWVCE